MFALGHTFIETNLYWDMIGSTKCERNLMIVDRSSYLKRQLLQKSVIIMIYDKETIPEALLPPYCLWMFDIAYNRIDVGLLIELKNSIQVVVCHSPQGDPNHYKKKGKAPWCLPLGWCGKDIKCDYWHMKQKHCPNPVMVRLPGRFPGMLQSVWLILPEILMSYKILKDYIFTGVL